LDALPFDFQYSRILSISKKLRPNGFFIQGTHYLWMVLLLTLIARSPGALSLDRFITRRLSV
jgi:uncharacterized membrane protein YphA (DoxX/SURF4 family)